MVIRRVSMLVLSLVAALSTFALLGTDSGTPTANAQDEVAALLALDMDPTNGSGPCNPIDDSRNVGVGDTYQVAVCLVDAASPPAAFQFDLLYDDSLNQCVPSECDPAGCVDGNPDANAGATTWGNTSLGSGWDCYIMGVSPPTCDKDSDTGASHGDAFIKCMSTHQPYTLDAGEGISAPVAMVSFKALDKGTDSFALKDAYAFDAQVATLVASASPVPGGSVSASSAATLTANPSETPPAGATPGAETTPGGEAATPDPGVATAAAATAVAQGTPIAAINQAATATSVAVATKAAASTKAASSSKTPTGKATAKPGQTSDTSGGGSSGPNAFLIAGIVVVAGIVVGGGGWFGYRRFRATR
jgi:hypothetical protein